MLFRQFFDAESCTYTYLIASRLGGEAVIVDSVLEHVDQYLRILEQLDLKLVKVVDTHTHADHITAMGGAARSHEMRHGDGRPERGGCRVDAGLRRRENRY